VRDIQRSHMGQVLVQFYSVLERDNLVLLGPQQYLDATFTALCHNDAWNHRALFSIVNVGSCYRVFLWITILQSTCKQLLVHLAG
jgi:hypothetical protein